MPVTSIAKGVRLAPRKVGVVAALVRGRTVADALVILDHTPRRAAVSVRKAIASAQANAEYNHNYKPQTLKIVEISVSPGARTTRYRAGARGMAKPFQKRTSHIRVVVDGEIRAPKKEVVEAKTDSKKSTKKESK